MLTGCTFPPALPVDGLLYKLTCVQTSNTDSKYQLCVVCRLFRQPLVPLVSAADGKWLVPQGLAPILKPGGHGAIWKLMLDEGVFSWMYQHDREAAIVRQIRHV